LRYLAKKEILLSKCNPLKTTDEIINIARQTLELEAVSISALCERIDKGFAETVLYLSSVKGKVVLTGIGKSAIIAQKIAATLNSTGTASVFMHAADAIHGDLGTIRDEDAVICLSKSGNTAEIKALIPLVKKLGNRLIAIVGNVHSELALAADFVLDTTVTKEACPNNLAPTSSTTAQLAMGDALAVALLDIKGFSTSDFARYHPGGTLGKRLYLTARELTARNEKPEINEEATVLEVIMEISSKRLGATAVIGKGELKGVITDGDIRRMLQKNPDFSSLKAKDIMNAAPKSIEAEELAVNALNLMQSHNISQLIVTENGNYAGIIHMHDLIREGII
jgi:arabinose-5-phosphate isomerase